MCEKNDAAVKTKNGDDGGGDDADARRVEPRAQCPHEREGQHAGRGVDESGRRAGGERQRECERPAGRERAEHAACLARDVVPVEESAVAGRGVGHFAAREHPCLVEIDVLVAGVRKAKQHAVMHGHEGEQHERPANHGGEGPMRVQPVGPGHRRRV